MEKLTQESLETLVRLGVVQRVFATRHLQLVGGWCVEAEHGDHGQTRELYTTRGEVRVFKTLDAAVNCVFVIGWRNPVTVQP